MPKRWERGIRQAIRKADERARNIEMHNIPKKIRESFKNIECWQKFMGYRDQNGNWK